MLSVPSQRTTHPNLPKGKEQVTLPMISVKEHSPLSFSPVGEMQITLDIDNTLIIMQQVHLSLPYGGG